MNNSNQASVYFQVFFDSLYGTNTNPRLKNMALQFSMLIILGLVDAFFFFNICKEIWFCTMLCFSLAVVFKIHPDLVERQDLKCI